MDKARISITLDPGVLHEIDKDAAEAGLSRSAWLEKVGHEAHLRAWIASYTPPGGGAEEIPVDQLDRMRAVRDQWASQNPQ